MKLIECDDGGLLNADLVVKFWPYQSHTAGRNWVVAASDIGGNMQTVWDVPCRQEAVLLIRDIARFLLGMTVADREIREVLKKTDCVPVGSA
jgi:lipid-binding SYLF domain-containing protein